MDFPHIQEIFEQQGGRFLTSSAVLEKNLKKIKVLVFDWDGVFHAGAKDHNGQSSFSEVDSMAINMLRFGLTLYSGKLPSSIIVTGESNVSGRQFAQREHFDAVFYNAKDKTVALDFICREHGVSEDEVLFVFDDILDLKVAKRVGVRFLMGRPGNPLFNYYVEQHHLADYISAQAGGSHGIREICELSLGLLEKYDETVTKRMEFSGDYSDYWKRRQGVETQFFSVENQIVVKKQE